MATQLDARGWPRYDDPVAHIDHGRNFFRVLHMSIALLAAHGQLTAHDLPQFKIDRRHRPSATAAANRSAGLHFQGWSAASLRGEDPGPNGPG